LRSLQEKLPDFTERGVKILAVSVDPPETSRKHAARQGYTYPFLSDSRLEVIARYKLIHTGGRGGADISRPAEFLIDPQGVIRWSNLTENYRLRLAAADIFKVLDALAVK
jgi:peroxiredoxin